MILFKVTVKRSILQIGLKILKLKGGCTRIIVLWLVYLIHSTIIHVQQHLTSNILYHIRKILFLTLNFEQII
jgi:hypothetical protein